MYNGFFIKNKACSNDAILQQISIIIQLTFCPVYLTCEVLLQPFVDAAPVKCRFTCMVTCCKTCICALIDNVLKTPYTLLKYKICVGIKFPLPRYCHYSDISACKYWAGVFLWTLCYSPNIWILPNSYHVQFSHVVWDLI